MVKARSNILFSDYVSYVFLALSKKRIVVIFFIVCAVAVGFLAGRLIVETSMGKAFKFIDYVPLIVVIVLIIFYFSLFFGMTYGQYRKGRKSFNEESDYIFLNNKFVIARAGTETGYDVFYNTIIEVIEKKKRIFFYIGAQKSFMMKKNFLTGDISKLREIIKKNCPNAKIKLMK